MPLPSEAQIQDAIGKFIKVYDQLRNAAGVDSGNYITRENTFLVALGLATDTNPGGAQAVARVRSALNSILDGPSDGLIGLFDTYARVLTLPETEFRAQFDKIFENFALNSKRVKSRVATFGAVSAITGTGTGLIYRLTKDPYAFDIESFTPEIKIARCVADEHVSGGLRQQEIWEIRGVAPNKDDIVIGGSGTIQRVNTLNAGQPTSGLVRNPSFDNLVGTITAPTSITDWTSSITVNATNFQFLEGTAGTQYFRDFPGAATSRGLQINTSCILSQTFTTNVIRWDPTRPLFFRIAWNAQTGTAVGTLTIRWGNVSKAVVVSGVTGWNILKIDSDDDAWFKNWNKTDGTIEVEWAKTSGTLIIDDITAGSYSKVDGLWYAVDGGTTPFLRDSTFTWTDSATDAAIIQYWLWRTFGLYLPPATGGSITWADPT